MVFMARLQGKYVVMSFDAKKLTFINKLVGLAYLCDITCSMYAHSAIWKPWQTGESRVRAHPSRCPYSVALQIGSRYPYPITSMTEVSPFFALC